MFIARGELFFRLAVSAIVLSVFQSAFAQIVHYDGTAFPEEDGWIRLPQNEKFHPERYVEDGWFVHTPQLIDHKPGNQLDNYRWNLAEQAGAHVWYLEWVMATDGPASWGAIAPASMVAAGQSGIGYHVTIASNELLLNRGPRFPNVQYSFEPGVHRFRLELRNDPPSGTYALTLDGEIVDAGQAEGFYPTSNSFVVFGCQADIVDSETRWDYIEFGNPLTPVPVISSWGLAILALVTLTTGTLAFRWTRPF